MSQVLLHETIFKEYFSESAYASNSGISGIEERDWYQTIF